MINLYLCPRWQAMDGDHTQLAKSVPEAYKERLHLFEAGDSLEGGVRSIAAYGHTPGHTMPSIVKHLPLSPEGLTLQP